MTQKEVLRGLIGLLKNELNIFEFKPSLKEQGFSKRGYNAIYFFYFLIYNRTNIHTGAKGFLIEPHVYINISEIEKYYKEITLNTEIKADWDFVTLGNSIANLKANPDGINKNRNQSLDLFVFQEEDIGTVAEKLLKLFKDFAFSYYKLNGTLEKADLLLNEHPQEYCVHMPNDIFRFIKGLIAAKLNKNARLLELKATYKNLMVKREMPKICFEEMSRLESLLPSLS